MDKRRVGNVGFGVFAILSWSLVVGCGIDLYQAEPTPLPADASAPPIVRGLHYLRVTQVTPDEEALTGGDFAGDWPQYFHVDTNPPVRVRDISPFVVTFIHHALSLITDENLAALDLGPADAADAREMRRAAVAFLWRFEAPASDPAAGTFGFWPYWRPIRSPQDCLLALLGLRVLGGPVLMGTRGPGNISFFPLSLAIPTDADDTATVYVALLDDALLDGGPLLNPPLDRYFTDWRDTGQVPRRLNPDWLEPTSGAFLTWLAYESPPGCPRPNDVDLLVNADILYALARHDLLDTPGVDEAVALINRTTLAGYHITRLEEVSDYYPDNLAYQYCISRAYHEGPVPALRPAVERFADELLASVQSGADGVAYWDHGDPHLNTAFAVLTLLNAGRAGPTVDAAVQYLLDEQDATFGNWAESTFFIARADSGMIVPWTSTALTTAIAIEAICRHRLADETGI
jgi:hypothetical protein